jgi:hypothetical protein
VTNHSLSNRKRTRADTVGMVVLEFSLPPYRIDPQWQPLVSYVVILLRRRSKMNGVFPSNFITCGTAEFLDALMTMFAS